MKSVRNCLSVSGRSGEGKARAKRAALARPGALLAAMTVTVGGGVLWAGAQTGRKPVKMSVAKPSSAPSPRGDKPTNINDLPALIHKYAERRAAAKLTTSAARTAAGGALDGPGLIEQDITPNSPSDEREPMYSPDGTLIAFVSNGEDSNLDGTIDSINAERKYHVWVIDRTTLFATQVTGLDGNDDVGSNQRRPVWSPDSNILAYVDSAVDDNGEVLPQIRLVRPKVDLDNDSSNGIQVAPPQTITNSFEGDKRSPAWSPTNQTILFASNADLDDNNNNGRFETTGQYDLFSVSASGDRDTLRRLTGGTTAPIFRSTNEFNPAFSIANPNAVYFSSDKNPATSGSVKMAGRRIWAMSAVGTDHTLITNPTVRTGNTAVPADAAKVIDDFPTLSTADGQELLGFQSNARIDSSDTTTDGKDNNIWTLPVDSTLIIPGGAGGEDSTPHLVTSIFGRTTSQTTTVENYNLIPDVTLGEYIPSFQGVFSSVNTGNEGVKIVGDNVYVSKRNIGYVERYNVQTGAFSPPLGAPNVARFTYGGTLTQPTGLAYKDGFIYVGSGTGSNAVYRYSATFGTAAGVGVTANGVFTSGETPEGVVSGVEGLAFGPDFNGDNVDDLYVSVQGTNKINVYNGPDAMNPGVFIDVFASPGTTLKLLTPTGITRGKDLNGDGIDELYVCSSNSSEIYALDGNPGSTVPDRVLWSFKGDTFNGLQNPEGIVFANLDGTGDYELYASSFLGGTGRSICRFKYDAATNGFVPAPSAAFAGTAIWMQTRASGIGYFDFSETASTVSPVPTPTPPPTSGPAVAIETDGSAALLTNYISSPDTYEASGLPSPAQKVTRQDKAADIEGSFSRIALETRLGADFVFSSGRRAAPAPGNNINDPTPVVVNPYGGNELTASGAVNSVPTNDLWTTVTKDVTPPILIPQGTGNLAAPFIAPSNNSGFSYKTPRTQETGLLRNSPIKIAFVLEEKQSGISADITDPAVPAVTVSFKRAYPNNFGAGEVTSVPNESVAVSIAIEEDPVVLGDRRDMPVLVYDDGPPSAGGHERQGSAIAGDGVYYCESTVPADGARANDAPILTPAVSGDYYIDLSVTDRRGNAFYYDNIWGFSTQKFQTSSGRDLFVSDYTIGQRFRYQDPVFGGSTDERYAIMPPTESYYLTNPGGHVLGEGGLIVEEAVKATFDPNSVDVWRTLCRGGISEDDLIAYRPSTTNQIDPDPDAEANNRPGVAPFTVKERKVTTSRTCIFWAAPYAGEVFAGPGTITDTRVQDILSEYLEIGGRVFLTGRDILWATTGAGATDNSFMRDEMRADFGGEAASLTLSSEAASFTGPGFTSNNGITPGGFQKALNPKFDFIQFPIRASPTDDYFDASISQNPVGAESTRFDLISPVGNQTGVSTAYSFNGSPVGQRIETQRVSGRQSRAVFFSFNFDAVNRGYQKPTSTYPYYALDRRAGIAELLRNYFKTSRVTGKVTDASQNNTPVANMLMEARNMADPSVKFYVRSDKSGVFVFDGLPDGTYKFFPAETPEGIVVEPNRFYVSSIPLVSYLIPGGTTHTISDIAVTQIPKGSLKGYVVESHATPEDKTDDQPLPNLQVLVRSKNPSSIFTGGGRYAQLGRTVNSTTEIVGKPVAVFNLTQIPADTELEIVFNPRLEDIPEESGLRATFIQRGGQRTDVGRRVIPDDLRPEIITVPQSQLVHVDDVPTGETNGYDGQPIVVPLGPSVTGIVRVRGVPVEGATVTPSRSGGGIVPKPVTTDVNGAYTFADVRPGTYTFKVSVPLDGLTFTASKSGIVVNPGVDVVAPAADISVPIAQITGTVINGETNKPVANASVVLQTAAGAAYTPARSATSNSQGKFTLTPLLKGTYKVFVRSGSFIGTASATVDVTTDGSKDANVTVTLVRQGVYGKVTVNGKAQSGVTVELLRSNGTSFIPAVTTTTDKTGLYGFTSNLVLGRAYKIRANYPDADGDVVTVDVTYSKNPTPAPDIALILSKLRGRILVSGGTLAVNARVTLIRNGVEIRSVSTDTSGYYYFPFLGGGTYDIRATLNNASGSATNIVLARGGDLKAPDITLQVGSTTGYPTTFTMTGRSYVISIPYQTDNAPATNNKFVAGTAAASIRLRDAFDLLPVTAAGVRNYTLERLNPVSGLYERLDSGDSLIERGRGYRLRLQKAPLNMKLSATPLESSQKFFRLTLHRNTSSKTNPNNGLNLIGFGLNPKTFVRVDWSQARVITPNGRIYESPAEAASAGVMDAGIFTLDPNGSTETTVYRKNVIPFAGYYARTYVDGVTIVLRNPDEK